MTKQEFEKTIKSMRDKDAELMNIRFRNVENRAGKGSLGILRFGHKIYPGDQFEFYELQDGETYRLPRGVVKHLRNNCFYLNYQRLDGALGNAGIAMAAPDGRLSQKSMYAQSKVYRFACDSLDFDDEDTELTRSNLIQVIPGV